VTLSSLVEGWARERRPAETTRYTVEIRVGLLARHLGHEDAARVTADALLRRREALVSEGRTPRAAQNYLSDVKTLLAWAADARRIGANPGKDVRPVAGKGRKSGERRLPFDDDAARLVLEAARGLEGADRWLPRLLAFTGAQVEEVARALASDVRESGGVAYLDINDEGAGKSLKNAGSARRVPLHPALAVGGFLDDVAGLPRDGQLSPT
jgi:hypothetical protein